MPGIGKTISHYRLVVKLGALALFTDDAIWMHTGYPAFIGKDAIRARLQQIFNESSFEDFKQTVDEIRHT